MATSANAEVSMFPQQPSVLFMDTEFLSTDFTFPQSDLVEYNQCQSALRNLYELGIAGKSEEFLAYRILYLLHVRNRSGSFRPSNRHSVR